MSIIAYTGTGGAHGMFIKLMELLAFKNLETVSGSLDEGGEFKAWLTDEVYFHWNSDAGWADAYCGTTKFPFVPTTDGNDSRAWAITQTGCGYALAVNDDIRAFISRTIDSAGNESLGVVAYGSIDTTYHAIIADGMPEPWKWIHSHKFTASEHFTQLYNATPATTPIYFPDLYIIACSPFTTTRTMTMNGNKYFCTMYIALLDERTSEGGGASLADYYTKSQTDSRIAVVQTGVEENAAMISTLQAYAAPMQDASVEGRYMKFAEYTFPKAANYESTDISFLVRNRGVNVAAEDGVLRVRLRYGKAAAAFQYAQIYWTACNGIDPAKFILCYNANSGTAALYLDANTAYEGYICKVLDMGTSAKVVDFTAWELYSPTTGTAELPAESDGWATVASTDSTAAAVSE